MHPEKMMSFWTRASLSALAVVVILGVAGGAAAQVPPPPPPGGPLPAPPQPAGNQVTAAKANLGKALFWDEQLSSTRTVSCGTCHIPTAGGSDPRSLIGDLTTAHPGFDGIFGTADDIAGSRGVPLNLASGLYDNEASFGLLEQVTDRKAPSMINAAYAPLLFWDGRASNAFVDPLTGLTVLAAGAALESQSIAPPISAAEMAHVGRDWNDVAARVEASTPLALSPEIPAALETFINGRSYPEMFAQAFGSSDVTPARIALAIATYERTLFSNQTPFDAALAGQPALTLEEQRGMQVFGAVGCARCHAGALTSDNQFHYIGVRPAFEDLGRFIVTGDPADRGAMRTPSLRNVELRSPYFHSGRFATLDEVVDFYDRGGDFNAPSKDPRIVPLNMTAQQKSDLLAFLRRPLTDQRVANGVAPFDRPLLYTESECVPRMEAGGVAGSGGFTPQGVVIEPPVMGNPNFTSGVTFGLGGATATLVIDLEDPGEGLTPLRGALAHESVSLGGDGAGGGFGSVALTLPNGAGDAGSEYFGRWYVEDPAAASGVAVSPVFSFVLFAEGNVTTCPLDLNGDRDVGGTELAGLLSAWGDCAGDCLFDMNASGGVDGMDLALLLARWGACP